MATVSVGSVIENGSNGHDRPSEGHTIAEEGVLDGDLEGVGDTPRYDVHVTRSAYTVPQLRRDLCYQPRQPAGMKDWLRAQTRKCCLWSPGRCWALLLLRVPALAWLPHYSFKKDLMGDMMAGMTVAVMHVPQGMAYAMLAEVPPIIGLYSAFFPVLAYAFLGTSRHISVGTFAVACLMAGKVVGELATPTPDPDTPVSIAAASLQNATSGTILSPLAVVGSFFPSDVLENATDQEAVGGLAKVQMESGRMTPTEEAEGTALPTYTPVQVCVAVSFMVGVWQVLFALLQLGHVVVFLSDMLVSGFTTGAACHVLSSQIKHMLGVHVKRYSGPFRLIYTYIDVFRILPEANVTSVVISIVCIVVLVANNELLKPRLKSITNFPVPIELIVVVVGTVLEYFTLMEQTHGLQVVGDIPTGLPEPELPDHRLFLPILLDSFVMALVIYAISFSMAKIFANKHGYHVDATQELYAGGLSNIFGSMFSSVPSTVSLSRSLIQDTLGGRTQVASLVSCAIIVVILLFVGPMFETLPTCVLASIILVALKGMFMQVSDFLLMWKLSRLDALLWLFSFLVTVLVDIDYGLACGILLSIMLLLLRNNRPTVTRLGWLPGTDVYVDIDTYQSAVSVTGAVLCRVAGPLHFANVENFRSSLTTATGLDVSGIAVMKAKREAARRALSESHCTIGANAAQAYNAKPAPDTTDQHSTEQAIVENTSHNHRTNDAVREAIVSIFKRKNIYAGENSEEERRVSTGHHNLAFVPDDPYAKLTTPKVTSFARLKRGFRPSTKSSYCDIVDTRLVVICLSGVGWIDVTAAKLLSALFAEHSKAGIAMALAGVNDGVLQMLCGCGGFATIPDSRIFISVHDALTYLMPEAVLGATIPTRGAVSTFHSARPAVVAQSRLVPDSHTPSIHAASASYFLKEDALKKEH